MKGLLIKDYYLLGNQWKSLGLIVICAICMSFSMEASSSIVYLGMIGTIVSLSTLSYDEMDNGYCFLLTFPVSRKTFVKEKYIFSFVIAALFCVAGLLVSIVVGFLKDGVLIQDIAETMLMSVMMGMFLFSVMIPLRLKYGSEKSKFVLFGIFGICMLAGVFLSKGDSALPAQLAEILSGLDFRMVFAALLVLTVGLCFLSMKISERIMMKKEF